jgi:hypothetical protein
MEAKDSLSDKKHYQNASIEDKVSMEIPYLQTTLLVNELVNLEHDIVGGYVKIKEKSGKRKDRYSSLGYANYLAKILEGENLQQDEYDIDDDLVYF